jgi:hypothetical protein
MAQLGHGEARGAGPRVGPMSLLQRVNVRHQVEHEGRSVMVFAGQLLLALAAMLALITLA